MTTTVGFSEMQVFVAVVTEGSFTAAARKLATDKARVSRMVQRMEEKFGARFLNRSSRRLSLTDVGREYFERASAILLAVEEAEAVVAQQTQEPKGRLKIAATPEFGTSRVDGWVAAYLLKWPKVTVETVYATRFVDIIGEGVDVAIRIGTLQNSDLSARRLGEVTYGLYGAPNYFRHSPAPASLADLKGRDLIMKGWDGRPTWTLVNGGASEKVAQAPRCVVDNESGAVGLGIALLPQFMARPHVEERALVRVLPDWSGNAMPVHAVFASTRYMDPKVRGFVDLCRDAFKADEISASVA